MGMPIPRPMPRPILRVSGEAEVVSEGEGDEGRRRAPGRMGKGELDDDDEQHVAASEGVLPQQNWRPEEELKVEGQGIRGIDGRRLFRFSGWQSRLHDESFQSLSVQPCCVMRLLACGLIHSPLDKQ